MVDSSLYEVPDWDDECYAKLSGEEKPSTGLEASMRLYKKSQEISVMLIDIFQPFLREPSGSVYDEMENDGIEEESDDDWENKDDEDSLAAQAQDILITASMLASHIRRSEIHEDNLERIDHAATTRRFAIGLGIILSDYRVARDQTTGAYVKVVMDELQEFRQLFLQWMATFSNDIPPDEWGVFK